LAIIWLIKRRIICIYVWLYEYWFSCCCTYICRWCWWYCVCLTFTSSAPSKAIWYWSKWI